MAGEGGTVEQLALAFARALEPLGERLAAGEARVLLAELGLQFPPELLNQAAFTSALSGAGAGTAALTPLVEELVQAIDGDDLAQVSSASLQLVSAIRTVLSAITGIAAELRSLAGVLPGVAAADVSAFADALPGRLLEYVVIEYLAGYHPVLLTVLSCLGVAEVSDDPGVAGDPTKPACVVRKVHFGRLADLLAAPDQLLHTLYQWGDPGFDGLSLIKAIHRLLYGLLVPAALEDSGAAGSPPRLRVLWFSLVPKTDTSPPGLQLTLDTPVRQNYAFSMPFHTPGWALEFKSEGQLDAGLTALVQPPASITVYPPSGSVQGAVSLGLVGRPEGGSRSFTLVGQSGGSRLEAGTVAVRSGIALRWDSGGNQALGSVLVETEVKDGKLVFSLSEADGFLSSLTSGRDYEVDFDVVVGWDGSSLYFRGSASLEIMLPVHLSLGPVELSGLCFALRPGSDGAVSVELSSNISASLGPLSVAVERLGFQPEFRFLSDDGGNLGPVDLSLRFKPPTGVGLAVDAGVVKGGGFLDFHSDKGEYSGALELTFANWLSVKAIGLITTRMPDGSEGFSLLILMAAELASGIQLGYGFRLLGVGGLLGLNRTMRLQPLMEGIRTGAVNSIMFPQNVVANAPRILSDLRTIFPPEEGRFLIGPMAKLGWGTPTLVSISLGIVIEIPGNIALLGVLRAALPNDQAPLLVLQANFAAAIEFDKERLYFFAVMYESRVLTMSIDGEMGLLVAWGADANFVVSAGGFHPQFNPPPLPFPSPKRVGVSILNESYARIRASGYFAITSNTAQFGAQAELYFGLSIVSVEGQISFDALLQFSPFYFIIETSGSVSLEVFGMGLFSIHLRFSLEGPAPWRAAGTGSISFFFFSVSADFDVTWGEAVNTTLDQVEALPLLVAEFEKLENWTAELPRSSGVFESLQPPDTEAKEPVLHPAGSLRISQRLMPLTVQIDKLGNQAVSDVRSLSLAADGGPDMPLAIDRPVSESFAMAQFQEMEDASKLSAQAYALQPAGAVFVGRWGRTASSWLVKRIVRYEQIVIDVQFRRFARPLFELSEGLFAHFLKSNAATRSSLSQKERKRLQPFEERIEVRPGRFAVTNESDNRKVAADAAGFQSEALAREYLRQQVKANPRLSGTLQVVPECEVNTAA